MREKGELAKFTKRERLLIDREIVDLDLMFGGLRGMSKLPDALVIIDPRQEEGAAREAKQFGIPVIALMNSDCDRSLVTHPIPANDASVDNITFILDRIGEAYADNLAPVPQAAEAAAPVHTAQA
jgi:small subunit ribosomal protein S2